MVLKLLMELVVPMSLRKSDSYVIRFVVRGAGTVSASQESIEIGTDRGSFYV
jgi:hypothetical protein